MDEYIGCRYVEDVIVTQRYAMVMRSGVIAVTEAAQWLV